MNIVAEILHNHYIIPTGKRPIDVTCQIHSILTKVSVFQCVEPKQRSIGDVTQSPLIAARVLRGVGCVCIIVRVRVKGASVPGGGWRCVHRCGHRVAGGVPVTTMKVGDNWSWFLQEGTRTIEAVETGGWVSLFPLWPIPSLDHPVLFYQSSCNAEVESYPCSEPWSIIL